MRGAVLLICLPLYVVMVTAIDSSFSAAKATLSDIEATATSGYGYHSEVRLPLGLVLYTRGYVASDALRVYVHQRAIRVLSCQAQMPTIALVSYQSNGICMVLTTASSKLWWAACASKHQPNRWQ
jgi:hypothetical protein